MRRSAIFRAGEAAAAAQINPRTVDRLARQAGRFTAAQIREAYGLLLDADTQLKTSARLPVVAVEMVIAEFPTPERAASSSNRGGSRRPYARR